MFKYKWDFLFWELERNIGDKEVKGGLVKMV